MLSQKWLVIGALNGFVAVAAGAFGAHALKARLEPNDLATFEVGVRYQMYHALALVGVAALASRRPGRAIAAAGFCFLLGIVLFSGSLYGLSLLGWKWLGPITPLGGVAFLIGWAMLMVRGCTSGGSSHDAAN